MLYLHQLAEGKEQYEVSRLFAATLQLVSFICMIVGIFHSGKFFHITEPIHGLIIHAMRVHMHVHTWQTFVCIIFADSIVQNTEISPLQKIPTIRYVYL